jgi:uncharacterized protein involved in exopolysaccharide biosynthesis
MNQKLTMQKRDETRDTSGNHRYAIDPFGLMRLVFAKRRSILVFCSLIVAATTTYLLLQPNLYTSRAAILPTGGDDNYSSLRDFVGMASGMSVADENSSSLFPVILRSDLVTDAVLAKEYAFGPAAKPRRTTLPEYFEIEDRDKLRRALRGVTGISTDARTGELTVSVETEYPTLSRSILTEYMSQLESYNLHKRKSRAKENQRYLERQLLEANDLLTQAESEFETYRKSNANWSVTSSPTILTKLGRLRREVEIRSSAYLLLQEQYEMAKFEAQKDIPIVRILDQPSLPTQKSGPFRRNLIILSGILSLGLAILAVFVGDLVRQTVTGSNRSKYDRLKTDVTEAFPRTTRYLANSRLAHLVPTVVAHDRTEARRTVGSGTAQDS